jgi:hypothetical protein
VDPDCKKTEEQCKDDVALDTVALWFKGNGADYMKLNPFPGTLKNVNGDLTFTTAATTKGFKKASPVKMIEIQQVAIVEFTNESEEYTYSTNAKQEKQRSIAKATSQGATTSVSASVGVDTGMYSGNMKAEHQTSSSSSTNGAASEGSENSAGSETTRTLKDGQIRAVMVFGNIVEIDGKISFQVDVQKNSAAIVLKTNEKKNLIGYYSLVPSMRALGLNLERPFNGSSLEKIIGLRD